MYKRFPCGQISLRAHKQAYINNSVYWDITPRGLLSQSIVRRGMSPPSSGSKTKLRNQYQTDIKRYVRQGRPLQPILESQVLRRTAFVWRQCLYVTATSFSTSECYVNGSVFDGISRERNQVERGSGNRHLHTRHSNIMINTTIHRLDCFHIGQGILRYKHISGKEYIWHVTKCSIK
jgi:hypothetical protein